jgi:hypothetical protein
MKGKESKKEQKKDKANSSKVKVQSEYQREKSRKGDMGLDLKSKA